jgi:hypothetical protein
METRILDGHAYCVNKDKSLTLLTDSTAIENAQLQHENLNLRYRNSELRNTVIQQQPEPPKPISKTVPNPYLSIANPNIVKQMQAQSALSAIVPSGIAALNAGIKPAN